MKTMAEIMAEDRKIMRHVHHNYTVVSEETKFKRKLSEADRGFRIEGGLINMRKNSVGCRYKKSTKRTGR